MKEVKNYSDIGQYHGYQEWYKYGELVIRANYKNDNEVGYEEWHYFKRTNFYIR